MHALHSRTPFACAVVLNCIVEGLAYLLLRVRHQGIRTLLIKDPVDLFEQLLP